MNSSPWHIAVLIPARNEEELLPRCLHSVLAARAALPPSVTCDIVLAADRCDDRTLPIAQRMLTGVGHAFATNAGIVGVARALSVRAAIARHRGPLTQCWLAHTDADCVVPEQWLVHHLAFAMQGHHAVAGIVDVDTFEEHAAEVAARFRASYLLHPNGSHPHVHGANMGVRADAYQRAGGWQHLATAEDHDLWQRLSMTGAKKLSSSHLVVLTSGRRCGRAPNGFAGALAAHNETAA